MVQQSQCPTDPVLAASHGEARFHWIFHQCDIIQYADPSPPPICAYLPIPPMFLGIMVALFFQCMSVLLNPLNSIRRGIKWALVAHTVAMFSLLTIPTAINLNDKSVFYINNREFPGNDEQPPGPVGYGSLVGTNATGTFLVLAFSLSQWLADGLLVSSRF